jgi:hypothetical protein
MQEGCEGLFGVNIADGAVCAMSGVGWGVGTGRLFGERFFWCQGDVPQAIGAVAFACNDDLSSFLDFDVIFGE